MSRWLTAVLLVACVAAVSAPAAAQAVRLQTDRQQILVNLTGGLPGRWLVCHPTCEAADQSMTLLRASAGGGALAWHSASDPALATTLDRLGYDAVTRETGTALVATLTSVEPVRGLTLVHQYRLAADTGLLTVSLQMPPGAGLRLAGGEDLVPRHLPGFGALYTDARAVRIGPEGQDTLAGEAEDDVQELAPGEWAGVRSRFWTLLFRADQPLTLTAAETVPDRPEVRFGSGPSGRTVTFTFYAGPIAPAVFPQEAPELRGMLFAALWDWLRALAFGMRWLLDQWQALIGSWGLAILLLSLSVKVLMWPLTWVAERWQAQVNRTRSRLQPELDAIRREHRGEEAHRRTLEVYARHGVSTWYPLRSLAGFLIQIPVFIAAFDMLGEHFGLSGARFLWIHDLSAPDAVLTLPFTMPFFGATVNLLPFLMTAFTVLAARLQEEATLSPALMRAQRRRLYGMAALFFVLLYTFPAGMVLYWTMNNLLHLVKIGLARAVGARHAS